MSRLVRYTQSRQAPGFQGPQQILQVQIAVEIVSASGTSVDGASAQGTAVKVAIPIGTCAAGASTQGAAAKVTSSVGIAAAGSSAQGVAAKIAAVSGVCYAGALTQGTALSVRTPSAGSSAAGALAQGTAVHAAFFAGTSVVGSLAQGTAVHVGLSIGSSVAGASTHGTATQSTVISPIGSCAAGSSANGIAIHTGLSTGTSVAGPSTNGTAAHIGLSIGTSIAGGLAHGIASTEVPPLTPIGVSAGGSSANGTVALTAFPVGRCVAGASTQGITGAPLPPIMVSGACYGGATAYGPIAQRENAMEDADLLVGPLMNTLLACLCEHASRSPNPPAICCFRAGTEVPHDLGINQDQCCEGIGYVMLGDTYPSSTSFPEQDIVRQANAKCTFPTWAQAFKIGLIRCVPVGDQFNPLECVDWNAIAVQNVYDSATLRRVACCIRDYVNTSNDQLLGMSTVVERQIQGAISGGCIERSMTITVQIPNCDC